MQHSGLRSLVPRTGSSFPAETSTFKQEHWSSQSGGHQNRSSPAGLMGFLWVERFGAADPINRLVPGSLRPIAVWRDLGRPPSAPCLNRRTKDGCAFAHQPLRHQIMAPPTAERARPPNPRSLPAAVRPSSDRAFQLFRASVASALPLSSHSLIRVFSPIQAHSRPWPREGPRGAEFEPGHSLVPLLLRTR